MTRLDRIERTLDALQEQSRSFGRLSRVERMLEELTVRLADGSRKVVKANHTHTLRQLKGHVATLCPGVAFDLKGGFPPKPLTDDDATLADAKLLNESIVVSAK